MLITLSYILGSLYQNLAGDSNMKLLKILQQKISGASVLLRKSSLCKINRESKRSFSPLIDKNQNWWLEKVQFTCNDKEIALVEPKIKINLGNWTSYLDKQSYPSLPSGTSDDDDRLFIFAELGKPDDEEEFIEQRFAIDSKKLVKINDVVNMIAWRSHPSDGLFGIIAEVNPEGLAKVSQAFIEGTLVNEDPLEFRQIISVHVEAHAVNLLRVNSNQGDIQFRDRGSSSSETSVTGDKSTSVSKKSLQPETIREYDNYSQASNESLASFNNMQWTENTADAGESGIEFEASDDMLDSDMYPEMGGEALSPSIEELAPEMVSPFRRRATIQGKPPNVLVYCGKKDSVRLFDGVKSVIGQCLNPDKYTIYHLKHEQVFTTPWKDNTAFLVIASEKAYDGADKAFLEFFLRGGTLVSFSSAFDCLLSTSRSVRLGPAVLSLNYGQWNEVSVICGRYEYLEDVAVPVDGAQDVVIGRDNTTGGAVMVEVTHQESGGVALLSQVNLDKGPAEMAISPEIFTILKQSNSSRFDILRHVMSRLGLNCSPGAVPDITPCLLFGISQSKKQKLLDSILLRLNGDMLVSRKVRLQFMQDVDTVTKPIGGDIVPVVTHVDAVTQDNCDLNVHLYRSKLKTKILGNVIMYQDVTETTMTLFDGLMFSVPEDVGLVAIATKQTGGKGRGGNAWLSPKGCAMFSLHVRVPLRSKLGEAVAYLQHIASLSVVQAIRDLKGYKDIDLRLKWPNDIYYGNKMKLGGVIVNSSIMQDVVHAVIGCGVNVSNSDPTICMNDIIYSYNESCNAKLAPFTTEEVIALTINNIERYIELFQARGKEEFAKLYYDRWLHTGQKVTVQDLGDECTVAGLDEFGYLLCKTSDGRKHSVHPDGNSFDMMKNLIYPKSS